MNKCSICKKERPDQEIIKYFEEAETKYYCRGPCFDLHLKWVAWAEE